MSTYHTDEFGQSRDVRIQVSRTMCGRAKWAMRFALLPFIPAMPVLALFVGWLAIGSMRQDVSLTGRGRAHLAVFLGLVFTAAQAFAGWQAWHYANAARTGPQPALAAGGRGDVSGFITQFEDATPASHQSAEAFLDVVNERYGTCGITSLQLPSDWYMSWRPFAPFEYAAQFEQAIVPMSAQFVVQPSLTDVNWRPKLRYIEIHDPVKGDLRFPPESATANQLAAHAGDEH